MTTDLWMLVWTAVLCLCLPFVYLTSRVTTPGGLAWGIGNREQPFQFPAWTGRAERAHRNLLENLAAFAILVLVAHVAGKANATTALGATIRRSSSGVAWRTPPSTSPASPTCAPSPS